MQKTAGKVTDAADNVRPYVERAIKDDELRDSVRSAYSAARQIYDDLIGDRGVTTLAARVASDQDIHDNLRTAVSELRHAADRLQGKQEHHKSRNGLLFVGIALGLLFNPLTGPGTRRWLSSLFGGGDSYSYQGGGNGAV
jgi:hypothetical protein